LTEGCDTQFCKATTLNLKSRIEKVDAMMESLVHTRKKRELLGSIMNYVFGVNDGVYRELDRLEDDQQKLSENEHILVKHTKALIDSSQHVNEAITHLEELASKEMENEEKIYADVNKLMMYSTADAVLNILETKYTDLISPIVDYSILRRTSKLGNDLKVSEQFKTTLDWSNDELCSTTTHKVYNTTPFELLRTYKVPQKDSSGKWLKISELPSFLAVDNNKTYFTMSSDEWHQCWTSQQINNPLSIANYRILTPTSVPRMSRTI
jgi:hypothetical protein